MKSVIVSSLRNFQLADEADHDDRWRTRRRILIISISTIALVAIGVAVVVGARETSSNITPAAGNGAATNIKALCSSAEDPESCYRKLSAVSGGEKVSPLELYKLSVQLAMSDLSNATLLFEELKAGSNLDGFLAAAADGCKELLDMAIESLDDTMPSRDLTTAAMEDFRTWLSAAVTYQDTCLEGFQSATAKVKAETQRYLKNSTELSSNSLAVMTFLHNTLGSISSNNRRLLQSNDDGFPSWLPAADRRLLRAATDPRAEPTVVVAKDGSGKFSSINAALKSLPKGGERTIVYVKKGVYKEIVKVEKKMKNVMIVGDGKDQTVITGSLNVVDGTPTFKTATLAVFGKGFVGRGFTVQNTAGAAKHQAVAMMSSSDRSAFFQMRFVGFQDTLYPHTMRQFYRDCDVHGTVDFIFGNAAVVLQNCNIRPRVPMPGQFCTLTAQGRTDKNQNTGTSVHSSAVEPYGDLSGVRVYLGRPWKRYATTVFMKTSLPEALDPRGWTPWTGDSAPKTVFYAEYLNTGPGSGTAKRVEWARTTLDKPTASGFTADKFVGGANWLPEIAVPYDGGL